MGTAMLGVRALVDGASWSGKEANHLFMNSGSGAFRDLSGISGLDHIADGRVFGILDLDRDGRQDFVLVNTNSPRVLAYRNQVGETDATRFVALRFEGGNDTPGPRPGWSTRDGYGALVKLRAGEVELQREFRCGEGLSAQNSDTLIVGLGEAGSAEQVVIRWPSGREQTLAEVPSGSLVTVFEDPARSPTGEAFVVEPYAAPSASSEPDAGAGTDPGTDAAPRLLAGDHEPAATERPALRVYTTMATWCASCKAKLPALEALRAQFEPSEVGLYGVPWDPAEGAELLDDYAAQHAPAYELLSGLDTQARMSVRGLLSQQLGEDATPAAAVTDAEGRLLFATWGLPSVSELRRLLADAGHGGH